MYQLKLSGRMPRAASTNAAEWSPEDDPCPSCGTMARLPRLLAAPPAFDTPGVDTTDGMSVAASIVRQHTPADRCVSSADIRKDRRQGRLPGTCRGHAAGPGRHKARILSMGESMSGEEIRRL
jgi:hypothetical protein